MLAGLLHAVGAVLRRIGRRGHFRSRDKDGGHIIDPPQKKKHAACRLTALSSTEPELLPEEFRVFCEK